LAFASPSRGMFCGVFVIVYLSFFNTVNATNKYEIRKEQLKRQNAGTFLSSVQCLTPQ
jgi:hypothetical protein